MLHVIWKVSLISGCIKRKNERQKMEIKFWSWWAELTHELQNSNTGFLPVSSPSSFFSDWMVHLTGNSATGESAETNRSRRSLCVRPSSSELDTNSASMKTNPPPLEHLVTTPRQQTTGKSAAAGEYSGLSEWTFRTSLILFTMSAWKGFNSTLCGFSFIKKQHSALIQENKVSLQRNVSVKIAKL